MADRVPYVAGNWKMNGDRASAAKLAREVAQGLAGLAEGSVEVGVFPPFVHLQTVAAALSGAAGGTRVRLGGQDVYTQASGAFTGEVSAAMLRDVGCVSVLIGHSERRHVIGESDELIAAKLKAALAGGLSAVLCVGETLEERRAGRTDEVNERQVRSALAGVPAESLERVTIAYEPVWAIGTGVTASPADAQDAHAKIRAVVRAVAGAERARAMRIQYGGSVKADNARELFAQPDIDGGLIGGASLKAGEFLEIVRAGAARSA
ncbi:MAG: triose-phosphate isomerase [Planctomycetota bacterium]|nr:triose-phosphate isomerase [Planctomycetota bacterium]